MVILQRWVDFSIVVDGVILIIMLLFRLQGTRDRVATVVSGGNATGVSAMEV